MANKFAKIAFTTSVKATQTHYGTRRQNERLEQFENDGRLTGAEADFISRRDGFYLATVGENGQPYIQFRGGASGFLKVLDDKTLGYADFRGNLQYISIGNLSKNNKAALFLMDYPSQRRLKILARIEVKDAPDVPELIESLKIPNYKARIERAMILHVEAFDWNCPQHIPQRFSIEEIRAINAPLYEHIQKLEKELEKLKGNDN